MTQVVRFGRMLKAEISAIRVRVNLQWETRGSVLAGTYSARCAGVQTELEVDSDADKALIASVIHNAKEGCFAEVALRDAVPLESTVTLNGQAFDFGAFPKKPPKRS